MSRVPTFAVTLGDPNGIGPEIAAKAALAPLPEARLLLVGDAAVVRHYAGDAPVRIVDPADLPGPVPGTIDLVPVEALDVDSFAPGRCDAASGRATVEYTRTAIALAQARQVDAVVGGPHNETAINAAGIRFSGYPNLIAELTGTAADDLFLMLVGAGMRIVHATLHERLADALARLDTGLIVRAATAGVDAVTRLGVAAPRVGLFGINPHAGENGLFGDDDDRITVPAAAALRAKGIDAADPQGADLLLAERGCDLFVAAFHDQGHIPIKLMAGRNSAALTIGADLLFSSVGHGSAPDIAGRGIADPAPLLGTLRLLAGSAPTSVPMSVGVAA